MTSNLAKWHEWELIVWPSIVAIEHRISLSPDWRDLFATDEPAVGRLKPKELMQ